MLKSPLQQLMLKSEKYFMVIEMWPDFWTEWNCWLIAAEDTEYTE